MGACVMPTCDRPHYARGLCSAHYTRWRRHRDNADLVTPVAPGGSRPVGNPFNPWSGQVPCPQCGSALSTLPQDPIDWPDAWRCVACHIGFHPSESAS